jgi:hypothetical protein
MITEIQIRASPMSRVLPSIQVVFGTGFQDLEKERKE